MTPKGLPDCNRSNPVSIRPIDGRSQWRSSSPRFSTAMSTHFRCYFSNAIQCEDVWTDLIRLNVK